MEVAVCSCAAVTSLHNQTFNFESSKTCVPALLFAYFTFNQRKNENDSFISSIIKFIRLLLSCEINKLTQFLIKPFLYLWVSHQVHH